MIPVQNWSISASGVHQGGNKLPLYPHIYANLCARSWSHLYEAIKIYKSNLSSTIFFLLLWLLYGGEYSLPRIITYALCFIFANTHNSKYIKGGVLWRDYSKQEWLYRAGTLNHSAVTAIGEPIFKVARHIEIFKRNLAEVSWLTIALGGCSRYWAGPNILLQKHYENSDFKVFKSIMIP